MKSGAVDDEEINAETINDDTNPRVYNMDGGFGIIVPAGRTSMSVTSQVTSFSIPAGQL